MQVRSIDSGDIRLMKTERLYYGDPYLFDFEAEIVDRIAVGDRQGVVLDRTAFYPTSGGQPYDTGTLAGERVLDCYEDESSRVIHVIDGELEPGMVRGLVDRDRRVDHIQQHSGQHVLSQAFVSLFGWQTVGFHLGTTASTIDLDVSSAGRGQLDQAEDLANRTIQQNRPVSVAYVNSDEAGEAALRKPTRRLGEIRVIDIDGFDRSACGGTHVLGTGEIGPVLITRQERVRKQVRVEFLCGYRTVRRTRDANRVLDEIAQITSAPPLESAPAVAAIREELQRRKKRIAELESGLMAHEAASFPVHEGLAVRVFAGRTQEQIRGLAQVISASRSAVVLFAVTGDPVKLVFARSEDQSVDVGALLKETVREFGGKGGGRPIMAEGGVPGGVAAARVLDWAQMYIAKRASIGAET